VGRIQTTPIVKVALFSLRVYLIILLTLIVIKFFRVLSAPAEDKAAEGPAAVQPPHQESAATGAVPSQAP
jgi:hypothetical protein